MPCSLSTLQQQICQCRACPRLVGWREHVAKNKVRRFQDEHYWGKAVPGFGDPQAKILVVGLAPAAHGANRTGRMFTGDRSGEWLYRALCRAGLANQASSIRKNDGLQLINCYITAVVHCAPPQNKPTLQEILHCRSFLKEEFHHLECLRVIIALGKLAYDQIRRTCSSDGFKKTTPFCHGATTALGPQHTLIGSYHPSQQNTFTKKLTEPMLDAIFQKALSLLSP